MVLILNLSDFVRHHCWLVNTTGKPSAFCGVDECQEHNIKDIKVTYRSEGPNIDWRYLKVLHPAIHVIRAVADHVENEFGTYTRGKKHTVPTKERDIKILQGAYHQAGHHTFTRGRKIEKKEDKASDFMKLGYEKLHDGKALARWEDHRTFERSTEEQYGSGSGSGSDGNEGESPRGVVV